MIILTTIKGFAVASALHILTLTTTCCRDTDEPHFAKEEAEAVRDSISRPRSRNSVGVKVGVPLGHPETYSVLDLRCLML